LNKSSSTLEGVIVSDNFAVPNDLNQGDILALPSPDGVLHLPILAVIKSYFDQQGCIFLDRQTYVQHWHDSSVSVFRVFLKPNSTEQAATRLILDKFSGNRSIFVLSSSEIRGFIYSIVEKWNNISYIPVMIAVFVAVLGIVNSLTVSIMDRKREIAVLRVIGAERTHVRFMLWSEALILVMSAFGLGLIIGGLQLYYDLQTSVRFISGNVLAYKYPFTLALVLLPLVAVVAWVSAIAPVEAAVRRSAVEGLGYE
jgi:putative ABC transport system permease protein